jgi:hypothetical protein
MFGKTGFKFGANTGNVTLIGFGGANTNKNINNQNLRATA